MALFKKQTPLESLRSRSDKLESRRAQAQIALDETKTRRQQHLLEADLDQDEKTIARLENDVVTATSRLAGLVDALAVLHGQIVDAEAKLQAEAEQTARSESAARLTEQVIAFEKLLEDKVAQRAIVMVLEAIYEQDRCWVPCACSAMDARHWSRSHLRSHNYTVSY